MTHDTVALLDVDNTLLDNDGVVDDLRSHLLQTFGTAICSGSARPSPHRRKTP